MNAAALIPGACVMAAGLVLYGFEAIDLFRFGLLFALHVLAGLIFVFTSPFFLPKIQSSARSPNPFASAGEDTNPFSLKKKR